MKLVLLLLTFVALSCALEVEVKKEAKSFEKVEASTKDVAKAVVAGDKSAALSEGEKAIERIRQRAQELSKRRQQCLAMATYSMRDDCLTEWRKDVKRNKAQRKLIAKMERCARKYKSDDTKRKECVKKVAVAYLKLRPVRVVVAQDAKPIVKDVELAVAALKTKGKDAEKDVSKAVAALYKRLADIRKMRSKCHKLESAQLYTECMAPIKKLMADNREGRKTLKSLRRCSKINDFNRRKSCVEKYEDRLLNLVAPGNANEAPNSVADLDQVVVKNADKDLSQIAKLNAEFNACESGRCRRRIRATIRRLQKAVDELRPRFGPRRRCLKQRQQMRAREFRRRAEEHAQLTRIHRKATDCDNAPCTVKLEEQQHTLEKFIDGRRANFTAAWKKLRCPFVAPASDIKEVKKTLQKIKDSDLKSLRSMRQRLVELYAQLDECENGECKAKARSDIADLKKLIALLVQVQARTLRRKRADHRRRARLHRKLTKYYLLASECQSRKCRLTYRQKLRQLSRVLKRLDLDELGRTSKDVARMNKYYRTLQKALRRCPRSSIGHQCRLMVVHAFRAGTELRQKALLQYLRKTAQRKATKAATACKADKACVQKVTDNLSKRLAKIQVREMRIEKRRALRLCELTANKKKCQSDVEKEFARDTNIAANDAKKAAAATIAKATDAQKSKDEEKKAVVAKPAAPAAKRAGAASVVSVSVAVVCMVVVALLF